MNNLQQLLWAATRAKLGGCELAVFCRLLCLPDFRLGARSLLWSRRWSMAKAGEQLPHSPRQIRDACDSLAARGWVRQELPRTWQRNDPELTVLPLIVLGASTSSPAEETRPKSIRGGKVPLAGSRGGGKVPRAGRSTKSRKKSAKGAK